MKSQLLPASILGGEEVDEQTREMLDELDPYNDETQDSELSLFRECTNYNFETGSSGNNVRK